MAAEFPLRHFDAIAPGSPLGDGRFVFLAGSAGKFLRSEVLGRDHFNAV